MLGISDNSVRFKSLSPITMYYVINSQSFYRFDLYVRIRFFSALYSGGTSVSANDGKWHHICVTWESTAGSWKLFKDGKVAVSRKGFKTGRFFFQ